MVLSFSGNVLTCNIKVITGDGTKVHNGQLLQLHFNSLHSSIVRFTSTALFRQPMSSITMISNCINLLTLTVSTFTHLTSTHMYIQYTTIVNKTVLPD